jgi:hypothetical protein
MEAIGRENRVHGSPYGAVAVENRKSIDTN